MSKKQQRMIGIFRCNLAKTIVIIHYQQRLFMVCRPMFHQAISGFIRIAADCTYVPGVAHVVAFNMVLHDIFPLAHFCTYDALKALLGREGQHE